MSRELYMVTGKAPEHFTVLVILKLVSTPSGFALVTNLHRSNWNSLSYLRLGVVLSKTWL
jgi:hypothetical protein